MRKAGEAVTSRAWPLLGGGRLWVQLLQAAALAAAGAYVFAPVGAMLWRLWWSSEMHSYGALIPVACAYFAWDRRAPLRGLAARPSPWAIPLALGAVGAFGLGAVGSIVVFQVLGMVMYVSAIVLAVWGLAVWRTLSFPLGFLLFLVPVPSLVLDRIAFPLQLFAARFAGAVLELWGIPALIDGIMIQLPNTVLQVAVACAGLRFLTTTTMMGVIIAYWGQRTFLRRLLVAVLAIPTAILANASRVAGTGVLAYVMGPEAAEGFFHSFSGSIVFWLGIVSLVGLGALIRRVGRGEA